MTLLVLERLMELMIDFALLPASACVGTHLMLYLVDSSFFAS